MKPIFKYIAFLLFCVLIASCNPVKQVLKDRNKFEQVAREVVKQGYCINDTVTVTKDSVIHDTTTNTVVQKDTVDTKCPDFVRTFKDGTEVSSLNGQISVKTFQKTITKTVTITVTNNIRDKKLESILREERDIALDKLAKETEAKNIALKEASKQKTQKIVILIIVGIALLGIGFVKFRKLLPF